jgi:hypothetical protein
MAKQQTKEQNTIWRTQPYTDTMLKQLRKIFNHKDADVTVPAAADDGALLVTIYSTLQTLPEPTFLYELHARRDAADPALATHLAGFMVYVQGLGGGQMTSTKYHVLRHIQRTRQQMSFTVEDAQFNAAAAWAESANALLFLEDGDVRDPEGRILVSSVDGSAEPDAEVPYPKQAWERKARTEAQLQERGMQTPAHLPPVLCEPELCLREAPEVAARALALFAVAVRAESLAAGAPIPLDQLEQKLPGLAGYLSPEEAAFLHAPQPDAEELAQFSWRYESLGVLEWALGLSPSLPYPDALSGPPLVARAIVDGGWEGLMRDARLRPAGEILDMLDLHFRLHWLVRQARIEDKPAPGALDAGVVLERHHALNWLVRFEDHAWDAVDTPT